MGIVPPLGEGSGSAAMSSASVSIRRAAADGPGSCVLSRSGASTGVKPTDAVRAGLISAFEPSGAGRLLRLLRLRWSLGGLVTHRCHLQGRTSADQAQPIAEAYRNVGCRLDVTCFVQPNAIPSTAADGL